MKTLVLCLLAMSLSGCKLFSNSGHPRNPPATPPPPTQPVAANATCFEMNKFTLVDQEWCEPNIIFGNTATWSSGDKSYLVLEASGEHGQVNISTILYKDEADRLVEFKCAVDGSPYRFLCTGPEGQFIDPSVTPKEEASAHFKLDELRFYSNSCPNAQLRFQTLEYTSVPCNAHTSNLMIYNNYQDAVFNQDEAWYPNFQLSVPNNPNP